MRGIKYRTRFALPSMYPSKILEEYDGMGATRGFLEFNIANIVFMRAISPIFIIPSPLLFDVKILGKDTNIEKSIMATPCPIYYNTVLTISVNDIEDERNLLKEILTEGVNIEITPRNPKPPHRELGGIAFTPTINIVNNPRRFRNWSAETAYNGYREVLVRNSALHRMDDIDTFIEFSIDDCGPWWDGISTYITSEGVASPHSQPPKIELYLPSKIKTIQHLRIPISGMSRIEIKNADVLRELDISRSEFLSIFHSITSINWSNVVLLPEYKQFGIFATNIKNFIKSTKDIDMSTDFKDGSDKIDKQLSKLFEKSVINLLNSSKSSRGGEYDSLWHGIRFIIQIIEELNSDGIETPNGFLGVHKTTRYISDAISFNREDDWSNLNGLSILCMLLAIRGGDDSTIKEVLSDIILVDHVKHQVGIMNAPSDFVKGDYARDLAASPLGRYINEDRMRLVAFWEEFE